MFGDVAEMHGADKLVEIHSSGENYWTGRDTLLGQRLLDWPSTLLMRELVDWSRAAGGAVADVEARDEDLGCWGGLGQVHSGCANSQLATDIYSSPSELLVDQALKSMVTSNWASALEDELLKLTGALEKLTVELPTKTIAEYKKLTGFEMGLVRTCQVSYEYGYRVVLAKFKA
ncbi:hypothetical protein B296_00021364 [Ensete ventricosum]|uniref:Uncharacterized protein n=1 Tax=Ensete ventricosum TaxID=4639 RepID=A0A426YYK2_ENSVE|nr:hypothetical protein B296_00021364 [Ensete ventricosum]